MRKGRRPCNNLTMLAIGLICLCGGSVALGQTVPLNVSAPLNASINSMAAASALAKQYYEQQTPLTDVDLCDHCACDAPPTI